jgi:hypothetical protein
MLSDDGWQRGNRSPQISICKAESAGPNHLRNLLFTHHSCTRYPSPPFILSTTNQYMYICFYNTNSRVKLFIFKMDQGRSCTLLPQRHPPKPISVEPSEKCGATSFGSIQRQPCDMATVDLGLKIDSSHGKAQMGQSEI